MDFWDLTKLLFRRWYVSLPLLLASVTAVLLAGSTVKPDYRATGHVQLIPARGEREPTDLPSRNPWPDLGMEALGHAVVLNVQAERVSRDLVAAGLTENFTVTMEDKTTFFAIESVGRTPQQATATTQRLMEMVKTQVRAQQAQFGVAEGDLITTLALDNGDQVESITTMRKRFLLVAIGLCLVLTVAITVALDALLRWRYRRRRSRVSVIPPPPAAWSPGGDPTDEARLDPMVVPSGGRKTRATPAITAQSPSAVPSAPALSETRNPGAAREPGTVSVEHRVSGDEESRDERTRSVLAGLERVDSADGDGSVAQPRSSDPALGQTNKGR